MEIDTRDQVMKLKECLVMLEEQIDALETQRFGVSEMLDHAAKDRKKIAEYVASVRDQIMKERMNHNNAYNSQLECLNQLKVIERSFIYNRLVVAIIGGFIGGITVLGLPGLLGAVFSFFGF